MSEPFRLNRRFPAAMTERGYRRMRRISQEAGLSEGELMSFVFEHFDSVIDEDNFNHRLRLFQSGLEQRKR